MLSDSHRRLLLNYAGARRSWESWCYLNNIHLKNNNPEIKRLVNKNVLLTHLRYLALKDLHIELSKIIKDNERTCADNIFLAIRKRSKDVDTVLEHLEISESLSAAINKVNAVRDKFYAHLDKDFENTFNKKFNVSHYYDILVFIEKGIKLLGIEDALLLVLKDIPSRDEFTLIE